MVHITRSATLTDEERSRGLITASAGKSCTGRCICSKTVWMQSYDCYAYSYTADQSKPYKSFGADVVLHGDVYDDAYAYACKLAEENGYTFVHPFNDP